jgi:siroheme synthase
MAGAVYLVGAGPGDPGLITVRGLELLRMADTVVYDALANRDLLDECREDAELIDAGKRGGDHTMRQEEINRLLVELAVGGRMVVRLKGGDPFMFGRGAEEAAELRGAGVEVHVVPGISSSISVPELAGIPVTHRDCAGGGGGGGPGHRGDPLGLGNGGPNPPRSSAGRQAGGYARGGHNQRIHAGADGGCHDPVRA